MTKAKDKKQSGPVMPKLPEIKKRQAINLALEALKAQEGPLAFNANLFERGATGEGFARVWRTREKLRQAAAYLRSL